MSSPTKVVPTGAVRSGQLRPGESKRPSPKPSSKGSTPSAHGSCDPTLIARAAAAFSAAIVSCLLASDSGPTFLMVDFARAMDTVWEALRRAALDGLAAHAHAHFEIEEDVLQDAIAHDVSVAKSIARACPPRIEHSVDFTAPMSDPPMRALRKELARLSSQMQRGGSPAQLQGKMDAQIHKQLVHYKARVDLTRANEAAEVAKCIKVIDELNPQFARVYEAAGNMVKREKGYAAFCSLESHFFDELNKKQKPAQPVSSVYELQTLSIRSKLEIDALMLGVRDEVDHVCSGGRRGNDSKLALGGVVWSAAPLKRTVRIVEKLCLDPSQKEALETLEADARCERHARYCTRYV